jgi:alanine-synthesizing transaminase
MSEFPRIDRLPPYVFSTVNKVKAAARAAGEDIIDFGMGNPDKPTPKAIVEKMIETAQREDTHRYSSSNGIPRLRKAISDWYQTRYQVDICPENEAVVTIGSKEGLAHLALAISGPGDTILVPDPSYPIHIYGFVMTGANIHHLPMLDEYEFLESMKKAIADAWPKPKAIVINFPANPTTHCVELDFFEKIIKIAKQHNVWVIHDLAYADIVFDGYEAPSILQVKGAKDIACETFSLSKSYNMPGWRVGFVCGNPKLVGALKHIKNYLDYGTFIPFQVAAIAALEGEQSCVAEIRKRYQDRRDFLCHGLDRIGWPVDVPKATMFVWAKIPEQYRKMGSLEFTKYMMKEAKVAVAPGIGFGDLGDEYVRFGLIENEHRTKQALKNMKALFKKDGVLRED